MYSTVCVNSSPCRQRATYAPSTASICNLYDDVWCKSMEFSLQSVGWFCSVVTCCDVQGVHPSHSNVIHGTPGPWDVEKCWNRVKGAGSLKRARQQRQQRQQVLIFQAKHFTSACSVHFSSFFYIFLTLIALLMLWPDLSPAAPSRQEGRIMSTIQHKNCCTKNS
jgi:hypothetical protein